MMPPGNLGGQPEGEEQVGRLGGAEGPQRSEPFLTLKVVEIELHRGGRRHG